MPSHRLPRKLVAVLYADAVGFSHQTRHAPDETYRRLQTCRAIFAEQVEAHQGRLIDQAGDSVLAIFDSAAQAMDAALAVRQSLLAGAEQGEALSYRMGLNLGDVIEDDGGVFGDGVNVAARLESLAGPGEIWVSAPFRSALGVASGQVFRDRGGHKVKNIDEPVRAYSIADEGEGAKVSRKPRAVGIGIVLVIALTALVGWWFWTSTPEPAGQAGAEQAHTSTANVPAEGSANPDAAQPDAMPTLLVLPFEETGTDAQDYFADGITEDLITDLAQLSHLRVLASGTAFRYKGRTPSLSELVRDLGVQYTLRGSIRRSGNKVRINTQLVEANTGVQAWGARYDRDLAEVFAVQDEVTRAIVSALRVRLDQREKTALTRSTLADPRAYEFFQEGMRLYRTRSRESVDAAERAYHRALELDPGFARAYGALGVATAYRLRRGWASDVEATRQRALELVERAQALGPDLPQVQWAVSFVRLFRGELDLAEQAGLRAIELAPGYADGHAMLGLVYGYARRPQEALEQIQKAKALNPFYGPSYPLVEGIAYYWMGEHERAIEVLEEAVDTNINVRLARLFLIAANAQAGNLGEARWLLEELEFEGEQLGVGSLRATLPFAETAGENPFYVDLKKAGLRD